MTQIPIPSSDVQMLAQTPAGSVSGSSAVEIQAVLMLKLGGFGGLLRSLIREIRRGSSRNELRPAQLCVHKRLPYLLVLPCCCLPHHLQLLLHFPGRKKKQGAQVGQLVRFSHCASLSNLLGVCTWGAAGASLQGV